MGAGGAGIRQSAILEEFRAAAEQGTPEKLAELEARLKALEERESKAATARKTKPKPARINGAHIKA